MASLASSSDIPTSPGREGGSVDARPLLVVARDDLAGDPPGPSHRWFAADFPGVRWEFAGSAPANGLERRLRRVGLQRTRCAWDAVRRAVAGRAKLLISTEPEITYRCALMLQAVGARIPHVAWAFNFAGLPGGRIRLGLMRTGFRRVARFAISSMVEGRLYGEAFGIPAGKFDFHLWSVGEPEVERPGEPAMPGDYICALGSNRRDYRTLVAAMTALPEIPLVVVSRAEALSGLDLPPNIEVRSGIAPGLANNILAHSRFAVLPLADDRTPNGHVTLVNSMKLARASIVTASEGIADYVHDGVDAVTFPAGSTDFLAGAIRDLWADPARAGRLGAAARDFASAHCSEASAKETFREYLVDYGLIGPEWPHFV